MDEPDAEAIQISESVAILSINGQSFGQIQTLNHCDKVITLASITDKRQPGTSEVYYLHTNQIDTATLITDSEQNVVWEAVLEPFGELIVVVDEIDNPLRFPGQYFDSESGLYYNWHRYYDPATGRYITSDPIGLGGGLNSYIYALGNPLRWYDSNGLQPSCNGWWEYMGFNPQLPRVLRLCNCYWLCRDCKYPVVWSGNRESLPSTTGMLYFDANVRGSGAGDIEAGNACMCRNKPGPETGCKDGDCGQ